MIIKIKFYLIVPKNSVLYFFTFCILRKAQSRSICDGFCSLNKNRHDIGFDTFAAHRKRAERER